MPDTVLEAEQIGNSNSWFIPMTSDCIFFVTHNDVLKNLMKN